MKRFVDCEGSSLVPGIGLEVGQLHEADTTGEGCQANATEVVHILSESPFQFYFVYRQNWAPMAKPMKLVVSAFCGVGSS